jgi:hypothetical protein
MRWLKHCLSVLLLVAFAGIVLATLFSDHSDDYGRVSLPQGGTVHLPKGKVTLYEGVNANTSDLDRTTPGVTFQVTPAGGGQPIGMSLDQGQGSELQVTRSETIGELGAIGKLDLPAAGDYLVSGGSDFPGGTASLEFGTNAGQALLDRWKLLVGLLVAAFVLTLIPVPRSGRRLERDSGGWSSDPRAPYAG